ncbi:DUF998 domain-containing protein [Williamsia deligens]|uniref:DUF998 domain-containing protein n=1 Tax=Williamsia deligens TaxID=321325 RepID=A0ABW3G436_9NOCA|nr:DUF998 domain-containing protein [Williamsia deligens]MCP2194238.1 putative membrane protein [Williamsia deligens]
MTTRAAGWAWLLAGVAYVLCETVAAQQYPDYSYARDYISALGVPSASPSAALMNAGAFVLHGILFATAGVTLARTTGVSRRRRTVITGLALANGIGNVLVGLFHAGASPLHGFGALLAIVGGNAAMIVAGGMLGTLGVPRWFCIVSRVAGAIGVAAFVTLLAVAGADTGVEGAVERGAVYPIIAWDVAVGLLLVTRARRSPHSVWG